VKDRFASVAEWIRRTKLDMVRGAPEGAPLVLKGCILCLRQGQHQYSVSPDMDYEADNSALSNVGTALVWSVAVLDCDEYFLLSDDGERVVVQRFTNGDSRTDKNGHPVDPPYPTTASYSYEQQGKKIIWGRVSNKDVEGTPSTWDLGQAFLAGWKMRATVMDEVINKAMQSPEAGDTAERRARTVYQGRARFVSTCKGVRAVACSNMAAAGLTRLITFQDGEPFNMEVEDT
jgi:hypothetical protein